ncbi:hypothetical protein AQUCO_02000105v1 [Aquilegia coerulea]|uniref:YABBY N-terminal domain-containing protein n=1 Tax=Aquilegia coerulea TaxID=218851 RepID=A0A2G5DFY8_AQUCA|nr:hypothetical protein AQUCO_02000105v1 [Aquilegia coerulea]
MSSCTNVPSEQVCYIPCNFCNIILAVSVPCSSLFDIVTVRCGHCTNLWSVNMAAALQSLSWQDLQTQSFPLQDHKIDHQLGSTSSKCNKISMLSSATNNEERIIHRQRKFKESRLITQISVIGRHSVLQQKIGHISPIFNSG